MTEEAAAPSETLAEEVKEEKAEVTVEDSKEDDEDDDDDDDDDDEDDEGDAEGDAGGNRKGKQVGGDTCTRAENWITLRIVSKLRMVEGELFRNSAKRFELCFRVGSID